MFRCNTTDEALTILQDYLDTANSFRRHTININLDLSELEEERLSSMSYECFGKLWAQCQEMEILDDTRDDSRVTVKFKFNGEKIDYDHDFE